MAESTGEKMSLERIEELLRRRYKAVYREECPGLDALARVLSGETAAEAVRSAAGHLSTCEGCAGTVLVLQGLQAEGVIPPLVRADSRPARAGGKLLAWPSLAAAAAALILVVAAVLWLRPAPGGQEPGDELVVKGKADAFFVAVKRGSLRFTARPLDRLLPGDRLGLFYSADSPGYLAIFDLDQQGNSTLIYPFDGKESARIPPGNQVPLPDGGVVGDGSGCEWLVAVFSDRPLATQELRDLLRRFAGERPGCQIQVDIHQARTVRVFPVRR